MEMKRLVIVAAALLLVSCHGGERRPSDVLSPEEMTRFMEGAYDVESAFSMQTQYRYSHLTEEAAAGYDSLLAAIGVTREQVEASFDYYSRHLDEFLAIQDSVVAHSKQ